MKKLNSGFTLIELLVVIAIIGLLSAVVLASLNTARNKAADAAVESDLTNIRAQADIIYDDDGGTYLNVCADTQYIQRAITAAAAASGIAVPVAGDFAIGKVGTAGTVTCHSTLLGWATEVPLKTNPAAFWCVDSIGTSSLYLSGSTLSSAGDINCG
jgi:prepilin-type N-terminal cleavage/methylation domain-containing protein